MKERLNKIISKSGICSRRKADEIIAKGKVKINGRTITALGTQADIDKDSILVNNQPLKHEEKIYLLFHKPRGYITTTKDKFAARTIFDLLPKIPTRIFPPSLVNLNALVIRLVSIFSILSGSK